MSILEWILVVLVILSMWLGHVLTTISKQIAAIERRLIAWSDLLVNIKISAELADNRLQKMLEALNKNSSKIS